MQFISCTHLDSNFLFDDNKSEICGYNLVRCDHPSNDKRSGVCIYSESFLPLRILIIQYFQESILTILATFYFFILFFFIRIYFMQCCTATKRHGVNRKRSTKKINHAGNLLKKNIQLSFYRSRAQFQDDFETFVENLELNLESLVQRNPLLVVKSETLMRNHTTVLVKAKLALREMQPKI